MCIYIPSYMYFYMYVMLNVCKYIYTYTCLSIYIPKCIH